MDIAREVGIRTASVHYYFPAKADLGVAVIRMHQARFHEMADELQQADPQERLQKFLDNYSTISAANKVCLVGALATAFRTLDEPIQHELKVFAAMILEWMTLVLTDGRKKGIFHFSISPRTKAVMIIGNMLSVVQLARLTSPEDVNLVKRTIIEDLTK